MQKYKKFLFKPLKNKFFPMRGGGMGNDIETSGALWVAAFCFVSIHRLSERSVKLA
jgi:hypothetical protein